MDSMVIVQCCYSFIYWIDRTLNALCQQ